MWSSENIQRSLCSQAITIYLLSRYLDNFKVHFLSFQWCSFTGTPTQYAIDYTAAYTAATAAQFAAAGYDAYSPYTTTATTAGYSLGLPAGYTYAMPQQLTANSTHFAQFQPQQIQERLQ